ncbi:MAG: biosynthetic arginine decarboxylase [Myxococcales bacterium]|nr:biosynthetic arginine decarboxylase [Myxococcales bacterium]USN50388.1 MAG: biosynthetic arginine decarboxylase [Myxococcales bacterium]
MKTKWTIQDSLEHYLISRWGQPFFSINEKGNLICTPKKNVSDSIDIKELLDDLQKRGLKPPLLIRFNDILASQVESLGMSFRTCIKDYSYNASYRTVMPIKVNQQRHVVEQLVKNGAAFNLGLEAGSKPELLVAMALLEKDSGLLICNGYKDEDYIETALHAERLGIPTVLVLDRFAELYKVIEVSKRLGIKPRIGIRAKLAARGKGRWVESSGDRSKFGLSIREIMQAIEILKNANMLECLNLLHFHIGSQITSIRSIKNAMRETAHLYCGLRALGCTGLDHVDVGGGLAIDYDGSQSDFHSSMNYSMQEYANDVVSVLQDICDELEQPHPHIISESGRALVSHHAVLIFDVLGVNELGGKNAKAIHKPNEEDHTILHTMHEAYASVSAKNVQECFNDIVAAKEESVALFSHGVISVEERARVDELFWATCKKIQKLVATLPYVPEDLDTLNKLLSDTYYCNFSVFQSIPDAWAVDQLFPIMPIHRLNEKPTHEAILADLTCDSDGKIDQFIDLRDVKRTLSLHEFNEEEPYFLGAFLIGAYQETLGDLHNLFGDTSAVHVSLGSDGRYRLEHVVVGDTVSDVLSYVEYDCRELLRRMRDSSERAVRRGRMTIEQSAQLMKRYEEGLSGYTYLV